MLQFIPRIYALFSFIFNFFVDFKPFSLFLPGVFHFCYFILISHKSLHFTRLFLYYTFLSLVNFSSSYTYISNFI